MKNWQRYPEYKDSGVEWLGEIPKHWQLTRLKYIAPISSEKLTQKPDNLPYIGLEHIESNTGKLLLENPVQNVESTVSCFEVGNVLFGKLRPYLAKVIFAEFKGVSTTELLAFKPTVHVLGKFLFYQLITEGFIDQVNSFTYGTKMPRVSPEQITNLSISIPPLSEQKAIAHFLDRETSQLDKLIAKKQRFIELLQEKRTALISHAVTKGLNPDIPMKDSGISWLGQIPKHWEVKRLKASAGINLASLNDNTHPEYLLKYIDIGNVNSNGYILESQEFLFKKSPTRARRKVQHGDIIISTVRTYLRAISLIENPPTNLIVSTGFAVLTPKVGIYSNFLFRLIQSYEFIERVVAYSEGVGYPAINPSKLACLPIWLPPLSEQKAIAYFLDQETAKIDTLIEKTKTSIEKLKEYRTALISAAVTGKIDIREEI